MRVLPDVPSLDKAFDYLVPEGLDGDVGVGTVVRVPLHGRRVGGWVVADEVAPPEGVALRPLARVSGLGPPPDLVELSTWAAWRWAGRRRAFLRTATPPRAVRSLPPPAPVAPPAAGAPAGDDHDDLAAEALGAGRAVVRLPPAADVFPLVAHAAARGDALVVAPSVADAALLARRLRRSGRAVAVVPAEWERAAAGGTVVVGARAAAWAPVPDLAAVVVVDAHDEALKEERAPSWNAWQVAAERARRAGVPCVLASPCPTLEHLEWGRLLAPSRTAERAGWAPFEVVDRRHDDPRAGLYSERLVRLVRSDARVACVLNRRGRARLLACARCQELARCERCRGAVEQAPDRSGGAEGEALRCRSCLLARPAVCQACGGQRLKTLRAGVTRVREELAALVGEEVGEVTAAAPDVPPTRVLVGTDAVLRRLASADAVAFLDMDQELLAPRFRAGEHALSLLARAARLVGGRGRRGRVLVQTRLPGHEVLDAALHADPERFLGRERERRRALRLPPAAALALVAGEQAERFVAGLPGTVDVGGPDAGRWLVRAPDHATLCSALASAPRPPGRLRVEVDPERA